MLSFANRVRFLLFFIVIQTAYTMAQADSNSSLTPVRITGIGGIFLKSPDPKLHASWYEKHLGIGFGSNLYFSFKWRSNDDSADVCRTDFCFFNVNSEYFSPSKRSIMLNLRVQNLDASLDYLRKKKVTVIDKTEEHEYGKFGWIVDPDGTKIELWQPIEAGFGDLHLDSDLKGEITGLGGVFIKTKNLKSIKSWYEEMLGIVFDEASNSHIFHWKEYQQPKPEGLTVFAFFEDSSEYFAPSNSEFMINFRVRNLDEFMDQVRKAGIQSVGEIEVYPYGKFGWIMDPDGRKVELWEPIEESLTNG